MLTGGDAEGRDRHSQLEKTPESKEEEQLLDPRSRLWQQVTKPLATSCSQDPPGKMMRSALIGPPQCKQSAAAA